MATYVSAQSASGLNGSSTLVSSYTFSLPQAISSGNSLFVAAAAFNCANNEADLFAISDSGGTNNYTQFDTNNDTANALYSAGFYCFNSGGISGTTPTITLTNAGNTFNFAVIMIDVFTINIPVFDAENSDFYTDPGTGTNAIATLAFSPANSGDLIWGACIDAGSNGTVTHGTGFTLGQNNVGGTCTTEYKLSGSSGSQKATFTDATHGANDIYQVFGIAVQQTISSVVWLPRPARTIYLPSYRIMRR